MIPSYSYDNPQDVMNFGSIASQPSLLLQSMLWLVLRAPQNICNGRPLTARRVTGTVDNQLSVK